MACRAILDLVGDSINFPKNFLSGNRVHLDLECEPTEKDNFTGQEASAPPEAQSDPGCNNMRTCVSNGIRINFVPLSFV